MNEVKPQTRMQRIGYREPTDATEPDQLVLVEYVSDGRIAIITLNRPHADNAITTGLAAQLIEVLETIAARVAVRVAISTDFIVASDDAVFGQPEAMVGLSAGGGSPVLLPRVLPPGKAMQMLMTGEPITAKEAHRLGMVNELHPKAELMDAVLGIAEKIVANSPTAVQAVKHAVQMGQGEPVEQAIAIMMDEHWRSVVHPDRVEGILAFNENREPEYVDPDF